MTRIALMSTSDTDLLSARASGAAYTWANPARVAEARRDALVDEADLVVLRVLGSPEDVRDVAALVRERGRPLVVLGGERLPNAALMELSTVPIGVCAEAHRYLAEGGAENLRQLHAFLSDTVLLTGEGFEPPAVLPEWGVSERSASREGLPRVGILYYRAHEVSGNQAFAHELADAVDATGRAVGVPIFVSSLRPWTRSS